MEQQNSTYYSSQAEDSSKPRFYTSNSYTHYHSQQGQDMLRHLSSDSGYHSNTSHQSDDCYADQSPITVMSSIPASPSLYYEKNVTVSQTLQSQFYESSQLHRSPSNPSNQHRSTPANLGWLPNSDLLDLYKFVVQKGKEPYFEVCRSLEDFWVVTSWILAWEYILLVLSVR